MIYEVPPADTETLKKDANIKVLEGPETRVVYLGMDQERDELLEFNVKGKNPFKDKRVREVFHRSIDVDAIKRTVMRGQSFPTDLMVAPGINGYIKELDKRPALLKPEEAKKMLADAGYPNGFEVGMDCPNDRYVNDEKICQAVVAMLAKIGMKVNLRAQTRNLYFAKILRKLGRQAGETSFYMLGWSPATTYDVHNVFEALIQTPNAASQEGHVQCRRLLEPGRSTSSPTRSRAGDRQGQARRHDPRGDQALRRRLRLYPAAPAGGGVGDAQEHRPGPAGRQLVPAALRDGEVALLRTHVALRPQGSALRRAGSHAVRNALSRRLPLAGRDGE